MASPPGRPVGPVLVMLPVALLGAVVLFDLSALLSGLDLVAQVARWILGTGLKGVSALMGMLNSCSSGLLVVNIDNGFGAGYSASVINHMSG